MQILTVVIGIIFVLLLLSLLATTLMELLSSFFSLRGRNLTKALRNMLASSDPNEILVKEFQQNSLYRQLTEQYGQRQRSFAAPSYMNAETFQSILFDVVLKGDDTSELNYRIAALPDADLRNVLQQLYRESGQRENLFRLEVQNWYNNVMDRAAGWYKRYVQKILIFMGLGIAILFNADTVALYDRLSNDPQTLATLADAAEQFVDARELVGDDIMVLPPDPDLDQSGPGNTPSYDAEDYPDYNGDGYPDYPEPAPVPMSYGDRATADPEFQAALQDLKTLLGNEIAEVRRPLGLGWEGVELRALTPYALISKLLGFLLTALAISMGAPFWFDLLKKLVNIRSAGNRP
ncbi:hypothetical protein [Lewinella sp. 4G2]|uniref:hypothetical protein n=1 Tax=Lewinella sp. 4G2 TaxID=1803372 RepID=UPI0007B4E55A|nr:hypothetical protein [Lewinella sp. 4G2]OAV45515.1 hypothetical protein A3850_013900 [Lewinella sp. 4G2]